MSKLNSLRPSVGESLRRTLSNSLRSSLSVGLLHARTCAPPSVSSKAGEPPHSSRWHPTGGGNSATPTIGEGLESRHLESRHKAPARLDIEASAGWASLPSRGLWGGDSHCRNRNPTLGTQLAIHPQPSPPRTSSCRRGPNAACSCARLSVLEFTSASSASFTARASCTVFRPTLTNPRSTEERYGGS
jgi:hypothetical protein